MARPTIGPAITLRLPEELTDQVDATAEASGVSRAEVIRQAVISHLENTAPEPVREVEALVRAIADRVLISPDAGAKWRTDLAAAEVLAEDLRRLAFRMGVKP